LPLKDGLSMPGKAAKDGSLAGVMDIVILEI
jgi:hypothetical protein